MMRFLTALLLLSGLASAEILDERRAFVLEQTVTVSRKDTVTSSMIFIGGFPFLTVGLYGIQTNDSVYVDSVQIITSDVDTVGTAVVTINSNGSTAYSNPFGIFQTANTWKRKSIALPPSKNMWLKFYNANVNNGTNTTFMVRLFVGP